jgi:ABC-type oligopeptide transport system substrate-binding subunit/class 3 adenylate cyclase
MLIIELLEHMTTQLLTSIAAYIPRDRVEQVLHPERSEAHDGVALIADLSGFTPLTEALAAGLSPDQGAEELTRVLGTIFTPLVHAIHAYGGSVLKFSGDALIVAYPRPAYTRRTTIIRRAIASALRMQESMRTTGNIVTPIGPMILRMKIGLVYGPFRRFSLGLAEYGYEDTLIGSTLDQMSEAEHHAEPGDILTNQATAALVRQQIVLGEERDDFVVITGQQAVPAEHPWPPLVWQTKETDSLVERLRPYLPAAIARTLAAGRTQVAELKPVVSMFVQFHGLDYDSDPQIIERLQRYFSQAQQAVERYGGRVNRLITGDKGSLLHVLFGAPISEENQEERAIRAALDLQRECGSLPFISIQRIGIAAGRVFAGPVGAAERHDYTTIGDAINLSARLMQNAADQQILLETAIAQRVGDVFEYHDLGAIRVKGKAEPIAVTAVLGMHQQRRVRRRAPEIFGRESQVAFVGEYIQRVQQAQGGLVVLTGELGMGKTLLLDVLRAQPDAPRQWLSSSCLAYGQQLSGYLVIDTIHDLLELPEGSPAERIRSRLQTLCRELFGEQQLPAIFPYLARFMSLPLGAEARRLEGITGEALRFRIFEVLSDLFRAAARRAPIVLSFDDIQWSDPTSLALIEQFAPLTQEVPLLLIVAMRPEQQTPAWALRERLLAAYPKAGVVQLHALVPEHAARMVQQLEPRLPASFAQRLAEHAGGNPLFLVELVRALAVQGALANPSQLDATSIQALGLPDSVQTLLLAQIDRLAVNARHVLQMAAVIGSSFLEQILAAIAAEERALDVRLQELTGQQFIQPEDIYGAAYRFRHALVQQSAYSTLLYERRRAYHREVAEALERLFPSQLIEQAALLGYHYERAEQFDRAIGFQLQAADSARLLAANAEAETLYRRALALIDNQIAAGAAADPARRARILLKLAQVRSNQFDFNGAQELYDQAFSLLEQTEADNAGDSQAPAAPRTIRIGVFEHGPSTLDPGKLETAGDGEIIRELYEGMVELDNDLTIVPACARRWQVSEDGLTYRFVLRPGLRWSDGIPLSAHDFVYAWRRNLHPTEGSWLSTLLFGVAGAEAFRNGNSTDPNTIGVEALDDTTLEIRLLRPQTTMLYLLYDPITYPQPRHRLATAETLPEQLVTNGAFVVAQSQAQRPIRLARNPFYRGFAAGNLDQVELRYLEPRFENYVQHEIDLCRIEDQQYMATAADSAPMLLQYLTTYFLAFACDTTPFNRREARQALALSIDRQALVEVVWSNIQKPAYGGVIPPGMLGHSPEFALRYDPLLAREKLAAAVGSAAFGQLQLAAIPGMANLPAYLAQQWREQLGIDVQITSDVAFEDAVAGMRSGHFQLALLGCDAEYPDPVSFLNGFVPGEFFTPGWQNIPFQELLEATQRTTDQRRRIEACHQLDRLLVEQETAIVPLYYYQAYAVLRAGYSLAGEPTLIRGGVIPLKHVRQS